MVKPVHLGHDSNNRCTIVLHGNPDIGTADRQRDWTSLQAGARSASTSSAGPLVCANWSTSCSKGAIQFYSNFMLADKCTRAKQQQQCLDLWNDGKTTSQ